MIQIIKQKLHTCIADKRTATQESQPLKGVKPHKINTQTLKIIDYFLFYLRNKDTYQMAHSPYL